jgi:imidazole glycerol phosphate synthase subunit HisF
VVQVARLGVDGVALASVLHYGKLNVAQVKQGLMEAGVEVRV